MIADRQFLKQLFLHPYPPCLTHNAVRRPASMIASGLCAYYSLNSWVSDPIDMSSTVLSFSWRAVSSLANSA